MTIRELVEKSEKHARELREKAEIGPYEPFRPRERTEELEIVIAYPDDIEKLSEGYRRKLQEMDASTWSGGARPLPNGYLLIILNPNQTEARKNVTVLEEVAHDHFDHEPTQLSGETDREYDETVEDEAYWTAAAALLPRREVRRAVWQGQKASELARQFGASEELAKMRIKTLELWDQYQSNLEDEP